MEGDKFLRDDGVCVLGELGTCEDADGISGGEIGVVGGACRNFADDTPGVALESGDGISIHGGKIFFW